MGRATCAVYAHINGGGLRDVPVHGARIRRVGTTVPGRPPEVLIPSRLSTGWVRPLASETEAHASRRGAVPAAWVEVTSRTAELPLHPISKHSLLPLGAKIAFAAGAFRAGPFRTFSPPKLTSPVRLHELEAALGHASGSDVKHGKRVAPQVLRLHCRR